MPRINIYPRNILIVVGLVILVAFPTLILMRSTPSPLALARSTCTRFAVIGDHGYAGRSTRDVARLIEGWQVDFIITTGDNNYPNGEADTIDENTGQYYHSYIYPYKGDFGPGSDINRFFPALGNHDWRSAGAQPYLDYFTLPGNERYYKFNWGPVDFFALDSDKREPDGATPDSVQAQWLKAGLAGSTARWQVVYLHHSPYGSESDNEPTERMRWPYKEWGVDVVLGGHNHVYERLLVDDLPYFIVGLGGVHKPLIPNWLLPRSLRVDGIHSFKETSPDSKMRYNEDYGAMLVDACESSMTLLFINRAGLIIDMFVLDSPVPSSVAPVVAIPMPVE